LERNPLSEDYKDLRKATSDDFSVNPEKPDQNGFNPKAHMPFGVTTEHVKRAMDDFVDFLGFVDGQLVRKGMTRFEEMLMPANFSSMVGEFVASSIPKYCQTVVKNNYHNGHPDLLPAGKYERDAAQHAGSDGIEIKASRYLNGWQGHNPEDAWLMVVAFQSGRPTDKSKGIQPVRFRFLMVVGALLSKKDWLFAGRSKTSRRTITASVTKTGLQKMMANWIYKCKELREGKITLV
jgi:hypothetical protein